MAACERTATWEGRRLGGSRKRRPVGRAGMQIAEGVIEHVLRRIDCACPVGCRRRAAAALPRAGRGPARVMWISAEVGRRHEGGPPLLPVPFLAASPVPHALRPAGPSTTLPLHVKERSRTRLGSVLCDRLVQMCNANVGKRIADIQII